MKKIFLFFLVIILSALLITAISTCTKEYSYEGGPSAAYTLVGSPDACTNAIVNGNYAAGISLDFPYWLRDWKHCKVSSTPAPQCLPT